MTETATPQASERAEDLDWIETLLKVFTILGAGPAHRHRRSPAPTSRPSALS
jgi:hypothetical protein